MRNLNAPTRADLVSSLDGARDSAGYRVAAELVPEPAGTVAELVRLPPPASVVGSVAWRAFCCGWLRGYGAIFGWIPQCLTHPARTRARVSRQAQARGRLARDAFAEQILW